MGEPIELGDDPILKAVDHAPPRPKRRPAERTEPPEPPPPPRARYSPRFMTIWIYRSLAVACLLLGLASLPGSCAAVGHGPRGHDPEAALERIEDAARGCASVGLGCFFLLAARLFQAGAHARRYR